MLDCLMKQENITTKHTHDYLMKRDICVYQYVIKVSKQKNDGVNVSETAHNSLEKSVKQKLTEIRTK